MTPLVMRAHRRHRHRRVQALGVRAEPAHHVRQLVRPRRRSATGVTDRDCFAVVARQRACRAFSADARRRRRASRAARPRRRSRRARRTASRGSSSSCATRRRAPRSATSPAGRGKRTGARSRRRRLTPKLLAEVDRGATGGVAAAPVNIVVCADVERGLEATIAVVDLPRGAEPAARGDRARARQRAHHDHHRLPRPSCRRCSALPDHVVPVAVVPVGLARRAARPAAPRAVRRAHAPRALRQRVVADAPASRPSASCCGGWDVDADLDAYAATLRRSRGHALHRRRLDAHAVPSAPSSSRAFEQRVARARLRPLRGRARDDRRADRLRRARDPRLPARDHARGRDRLAAVARRTGAAATRPKPRAPRSRSASTRVGLERIVSVHAVGNDASGNVMRKIGMHLDRETTHPGERPRGARLRDRSTRYAADRDAPRRRPRPRRGSRRAPASRRARRRRSGPERASVAAGPRRRRAAPRTAACTGRARGGCSAGADRRSRPAPRAARDRRAPRAARRPDAIGATTRRRPSTSIVPSVPATTDTPTTLGVHDAAVCCSTTSTPPRVVMRTANESSAPARRATVGSVALTVAISPSHVRTWSTMCEPDAPSQPPPRAASNHHSGTRASGSATSGTYGTSEAMRGSPISPSAMRARPRRPVGRPAELVADESVTPARSAAASIAAASAASSANGFSHITWRPAAHASIASARVRGGRRRDRDRVDAGERERVGERRARVRRRRAARPAARCARRSRPTSACTLKPAARSAGTCTRRRTRCRRPPRRRHG